MSDDNMATDASGSSSPDKRRSTVPDILPQQRSFEKRYSHIITRQILETGVNKEALQRQLNAFFSCTGEKKKNSEEPTEHEDEDVAEDAGEAGAQAQDDSVDKEECKKSLEKLDTLDIAEAN